MVEHACTAECSPAGLVAVRPNGERVPVVAEPSDERLKNGDHVLEVVVPEGPIEYFAAPGDLPPHHALTFISPEWVREQVRRALLETGGPESGPEDEERPDEQ